MSEKFPPVCANGCEAPPVRWWDGRALCHGCSEKYKRALMRGVLDRIIKKNDGDS